MKGCLGKHIVPAFSRSSNNSLNRITNHTFLSELAYEPKRDDSQNEAEKLKGKTI